MFSTDEMLEAHAGTMQEAKARALERWASSAMTNFRQANQDLKQLQGFMHYRLYDADGSTKMDNTPLHTAAQKKVLKSFYDELGQVMKTLEKAYKPTLKGLVIRARALDKIAGYK